MCFYVVYRSAILGENDGSAVPDYLQPSEIIVDTAYIPALLVKPAAGVVDQPGLIPVADQFFSFQGIELSPAFVEQDPESDTGAIIEELYGLLRGMEPFLLPRLSLRENSQ